jgi:release factor glutamine methyltransferase
MEKNVLDYEPHLALFVPGNDPLIYYKGITIFAKNFLSKRGTVYLEINEDLADLTAGYLKKEGFITELRKDLNGKFRMIKATIK